MSNPVERMDIRVSLIAVAIELEGTRMPGRMAPCKRLWKTREWVGTQCGFGRRHPSRMAVADHQHRER